MGNEKTPVDGELYSIPEWVQEDAKKLVRLIKICLDGTKSKVRIGNCLLVFQFRTV